MYAIKEYIQQHRVLLIVNAVLLALYFALTIVAHSKTAALYSQQEAVRWQNDEVSLTDNEDGDIKTSIKSIVNPKGMPYAQVSAFISPGHAMAQDELGTVRGSLTETLVKDSYAQSKSGGRVWIDAYSGEADVNLRKDSNTLSVTAVGIGGEFFQFHPIKLLSGSYISDSDINHDRIVVDENFAWAMFGSNDIVGMQVWLDNSIYFIAGVVKVDEDKIPQMAYGNTNRVYMPYDELVTHQENVPITCYEAVFPNPISNYAYYALKGAFGLSEESDDQLEKKENPLSFDDVEVLENTKRYEPMELITKVKQWRLRSMRTASVGYPFWENVARVQDDEQMVYLMLRGLLLVCPIISLIWVIYDLWERRTWTVKGLIIDELERVREQRAWKLYEARRAENDEDDIDSESVDKESDYDAEAVDREDDCDVEVVDKEDAAHGANELSGGIIEIVEAEAVVEDVTEESTDSEEDDEREIELRSVTGDNIL